MGLCLAAHTMARSKLQPLPPTDFSLSAVCGTHNKPGSVSESHAAHGPHKPCPMQRMAPTKP